MPVSRDGRGRAGQRWRLRARRRAGRTCARLETERRGLRTPRGSPTPRVSAQTARPTPWLRRRPRAHAGNRARGLVPREVASAWRPSTSARSRVASGWPGSAAPWQGCVPCRRQPRVTRRERGHGAPVLLAAMRALDTTAASCPRPLQKIKSILIRLVSSAQTGYFYAATKNPQNVPHKLALMKVSRGSGAARRKRGRGRFRRPFRNPCPVRRVSALAPAV